MAVFALYFALVDVAPFVSKIPVWSIMSSLSITKKLWQRSSVPSLLITTSVFNSMVSSGSVYAEQIVEDAASVNSYEGGSSSSSSNNLEDKDKAENNVISGTIGMYGDVEVDSVLDSDEMQQLTRADGNNPLF